jgi:hypothetical protein
MNMLWSEKEKLWSLVLWSIGAVVIDNYCKYPEYSRIMKLSLYVIWMCIIYYWFSFRKK